MTAPELIVDNNTYPIRGERDMLQHVQLADSVEHMVQRPEDLSEQNNVDVLYFGEHPAKPQFKTPTVLGYNKSGVVAAYEPEAVIPGTIFGAMYSESLADGKASYNAQLEEVKNPDLNFEPRPGDEKLDPNTTLGLAYLCHHTDGYDILKVRVPLPQSEGRIVGGDEVLSFAVKNGGKPLFYDQVINAAQNAFPSIFAGLAQRGVRLEDPAASEQTSAANGEVIIRPYKEMNLEGGMPFFQDSPLTEVPTPSEGEVRSKLANLAEYLAESERVAFFENHAGGKGLTQEQLNSKVATAGSWKTDRVLNSLGVAADAEGEIKLHLLDYLDQDEANRKSWLTSHGLDDDTIDQALGHGGYEEGQGGPLGFNWEKAPAKKKGRVARVAASLGKIIPIRGRGKKQNAEQDAPEITADETITSDFEPDNSAEATQDLSEHYDENGKLLPVQGTIRKRAKARANDIQNQILMGPESDKGWFHDKNGKLNARRVGAAVLFGIAAVGTAVGLFSLGGSSTGGGNALPVDQMPKGGGGAINPSDTFHPGNIFHPGGGAAHTTTPELPQTGAAQTTQHNIPATTGSPAPSHDQAPGLTPSTTHQPGPHDVPPKWTPGQTAGAAGATPNAPAHIKLAPGQSLIGYLHDARPRMSNHDLYMEAKRIMEANGIPTNAPGRDPLAAARFIRAGRDLVAPGL